MRHSVIRPPESDVLSPGHDSDEDSDFDCQGPPYWPSYDLSPQNKSELDEPSCLGDPEDDCLSDSNWPHCYMLFHQPQAAALQFAKLVNEKNKKNESLKEEGSFLDCSK